MTGPAGGGGGVLGEVFTSSTQVFISKKSRSRVGYCRPVGSVGDDSGIAGREKEL